MGFVMLYHVLEDGEKTPIVYVLVQSQLLNKITLS